jgi:beta-galactosidase
MKRTIIGIVLFGCSLLLAAQSRIVRNLNDGWKFHAGEIENGAALSLDDSGWRTLDLPHDFQIEQPWVPPSADERADNRDMSANIRSRLSGRGFKEMGKGWYRYHFMPTEEMRDRRVLLDFEGIIYTGDVYLNGVRIGGTDYGYVGFEIDVTDKIRWNEENVVAVLADTREPNNSRWYTGGGIFRDVHLVITPKDLYFERHPLGITTRENRFVNMIVTFTNRNRTPETRVQMQVYDPDGMKVYDNITAIRRHPQSRTQEVRMPEIEIPSPRLWDLDTPYLYKVVVSLLRDDGTVADEVSDHFGIRTVEIGPTFGLKLNGRKVLLKGYANHHTLGALGAAVYPRAIEKRILLMKQFGINHIRTSHNPYSRSFIELCDKYGILVVDELYDKWTKQHTGGRAGWEHLWQYDVPEWVKRDRNSPSVVMWSLGNELQQYYNPTFNDWGVTAYKLQKTLLQRYDSTRLVTVAMHPRYRNWQTDSLPCDLAMVTDVQAYNYRYMYFPGDGQRFPWMTFYQSEANTSGMGPNFFEMDLNKVIGLAYWGAIDYLGESQGWPAKGWTQGVFDISLEPKPKAYLLKSLFKEDETMVHIGVIESRHDVMWNGVQTGNDGMSDHWNRRQGDTLELVTYTNADAVELLINGKSLGTKKNAKDNPKERNQIRWKNVVYQPGYVEARAYCAGVKGPEAIHRIETTGEAVRLVAVPDNNHWQADGMDLQHVRIHAVDKKGRRVYQAQQGLSFSVEGDARIVAVSNGDQNSDELNVTDHRRLYNGSALVILRAGKKAGKITLTTSCEGMKRVQTKMLTVQ